MNDQQPPKNTYVAGLQHERTALAWERTAIAMMVAGVALSRVAAIDAHWVLSFGGVAEVVCGALLLGWAGRNIDHISAKTTPEVVPQIAMSRLVGVAVIIFSGFALGLGVLVALTN